MVAAFEDFQLAFVDFLVVVLELVGMEIAGSSSFDAAVETYASNSQNCAKSKQKQSTLD